MDNKRKERNLVKALSPGAKPGVVKQLTSILFRGDFEPHIIESLVSYVFHLLSIRGPKFTITYLKAMESQLVKHLLSADPNTDYALVKKQNNLRWIKRRLKSRFDLSDVKVLRLIMTLISMKQLMITVCDTELTSIDTKVDIRGDILNDLESRIQRISLPKFIQVNRTFQLKGYYLSSKAGPNGNSFASRLVDTYALSLNPADLNNLMTFAKGMYDMSSLEFMDRYQPLGSRKHRFKNKPETGKLLYIQEYGKLKCRVAAIVDGVTQELLKPVHDELMSILRQIPEDCTFDHNKISNIAKERFKRNQSFYGYSDLSDASDRIPRFLYRNTLNDIKPTLGSLWCELWTRKFFVDKELSSHMRRKITYLTYTVGQPMGALSSWPAMALVHHKIVWMAAGSYANAKGKYALLGDDIVIFDRHLYHSYLKELASMHIPFKPNESSCYFEFAKRHFINGQEFTGAYINSLCEEIKKPQTFVLVWTNMYNRGYSNCLEIPEQLINLLKVRRSAKAVLQILPFTTNHHGSDQGKFCKTLVHAILGLSACNYNYPAAEDNAIKLLHQATSVILSNSISSIYRQAAENLDEIPTKVRDYIKKRQPELYANFQTEVNININEIMSEYKLLTKSMEAQWKLLYITKNPNIPLLLRPKVPEWIYPFTLGKRNKVKQVLAWRSSHLVKTIRLLQGHT